MGLLEFVKQYWIAITLVSLIAVGLLVWLIVWLILRRGRWRVNFRYSDSRLQPIASRVKTIMEQVIRSSKDTGYPRVQDIDLSLTKLPENVVGTASGTEIQLAEDFLNRQSTFNGASENFLVSVLIHETVHVIGLTCTETKSKNFAACCHNIGASNPHYSCPNSKAVAYFNEAQKKCGQPTFGQMNLTTGLGPGSDYVHLAKTGSVEDTCGAYTGYTNVWSKQCAGMLEDAGFKINYSQYIADDYCGHTGA